MNGQPALARKPHYDAGATFHPRILPEFSAHRRLIAAKASGGMNLRNGET